jgi:hypothetical protein
VPAAERLAQVKGKSLLVVRREQRNISFLDFGVAVEAALVSGMMPAIAGNSLAEKYHIPDPADSIADQVAAFLQRQYGAGDVRIVPIPLKWTAAEDQLIATASADGGVIVNVQLSRTEIAYKGTLNGQDGLRYRLSHHATIDVRDAETQEGLLKVNCGFAEPTKGEILPTYADLVADDASLLKQWVSAAATDCVQRFTQKAGSPAAAAS